MFFWNSLDDPADVGNLNSGSSTFSKTSLKIWKFTVQLLLKPGFENFEHYFASMWDECNCVVVWAFFGIGMKTDLFQSCGHCWVSQICWHIACSTFTTSSSRIWNSSTGIPSLPLALFIVLLSKAHLTSHSRMALDEWSHHHDYQGHEDLFCTIYILYVLYTYNVFLDHHINFHLRVSPGINSYLHIIVF